MWDRRIRRTCANGVGRRGGGSGVASSDEGGLCAVTACAPTRRACQNRRTNGVRGPPTTVWKPLGPPGRLWKETLRPLRMVWNSLGYSSLEAASYGVENLRPPPLMSKSEGPSWSGTRRLVSCGNPQANPYDVETLAAPGIVCNFSLGQLTGRFMVHGADNPKPPRTVLKPLGRLVWCGKS